MKRRRLNSGRKQRGSEYRVVTIPKQIRGGMPSKLRTKLFYGDRLALSGTLPEHVFNGAGLYDPDVTGVGHQPRGFDQIMALYDHYLVTGSKIEVWFHNGSTTGGLECLCFILPDDDVNAASASTDVLENNQAKFGLIGLQNTGALKTKITHETTSKAQLTTLDYSLNRGTITASPSESWFWHIGAIGNGTMSIVAYVRIEYMCEFSEPKMPGQS